MKLKLLTSLMAAVFLLGLVGVAGATTIELVVNGEFEAPSMTTSTYRVISQASVPGWSNSSGSVEIWKGGWNGSPATGSDGLATGQHHEVAQNNVSNITTQGVLVGWDGTLDFSFDAWKRGSTSGIRYSLTGSSSGALAAADYTFISGTAWEKITQLDLPVLSGETLTLSFQSIGGGSSGAHIDQVSLLYTPVPEPSTLLLLGGGLAGLAWYRRNRK